MRNETIAIHAGYDPDPTTKSVAVPIYQTIAYARPQIEKFLRANDGHLPYPTTLAVITDTGTKIQQTATTDGNALSAAFDQYEVGPSAGFDHASVV